MKPNGRRTGILSDGTRVNAYRYGSEWTAALHYPDGGYSALVMSGSAVEFDEHNVEGPHMGTFTPWDAVPANIKRDIEQRAVESSMVANTSRYRLQRIKTCVKCGHHRSAHRYEPTAGRNAGPQHCDVPGCLCASFKQPEPGERIRHEPNGRKKKKLTVADLPSKNRILKPGERSKVLACPGCGQEYSADPSDYFMMRPGEPFKCQACGEFLQLADRKSQPRAASRVVSTRGDDAWDDAEAAGLVQIITDQDEDPDVSWADEDDLRIINQDGVWCYASQFRNSEGAAWQTADSICGVVGALDDGTEKELRNAALEALGGHMRNGRATTVDPIAARELDLYIANTYELVGAPNSIGKSIDANLRRKVASGKYDSVLAPKAWQHLVDEGAKRYQKEFGSDSPIFNVATRRQVAEDFSRAWDEENQYRPGPNHLGDRR